MTTFRGCEPDGSYPAVTWLLQLRGSPYHSVVCSTIAGACELVLDDRCSIVSAIQPMPYAETRWSGWWPCKAWTMCMEHSPPNGT